MRIFGIKMQKLPQRLGSPPDPHVITPAYNCNSVGFINSAKCVLLPSKKNKVNILLLLLLKLSHLFFISNSVVFVDWGRKNISCPGRRVP